MTTKGSFSDVLPIINEAASRERGVRFRVPSWGKAVNFRQRCYAYRAREQRAAEQRAREIPGLESSTIYDTLTIAIEDIYGTRYGPGNRPENKAQPFDVVISHREAIGTLLDADGQAITPTSQPPDDVIGWDLEDN